MSHVLTPSGISGPVSAVEDRSVPFESGSWYEGAEGARLSYEPPRSGLTREHVIEFDAIVESDHGVWLKVRLLAADGTVRNEYPLEVADPSSNPTVVVSLLPHCQAPISVPVEDAYSQGLVSERGRGGCLSYLAPGGGEAADHVRAIEIELVRTNDSDVQFCLSPVRVGKSPSESPDTLVASTRPLVDEFGQLTQTDWGGRTESEAELERRLREQASSTSEWPDRFSRWGGDGSRQLDATGYFRTEHDGDRWYLVDPDGHPFWSVGVNNVDHDKSAPIDGLEGVLERTPDAPHTDTEEGGTVNFVRSNLQRVFGPDWREEWERATESIVRDAGFNTLACWSNERLREQTDVPYVRSIDLTFDDTPRLSLGSFPDVFHDAFPEEASEIANQLQPTVEDPSLIGYYLDNLPFSTSVPPALAALREAGACPARDALIDFLVEKHGSSETAIGDAWDVELTRSELRGGGVSVDPTPAMRRDLEAFSRRMVDRLYEVLDRECKRVDPNHLNLGTRVVNISDWFLACLDHVDVFSPMCYLETPESLLSLLEGGETPVLVCEWHFGANDAGLPTSGLRRVASQHDRGLAYRNFLERAAAEPVCVGAHYFEYYDQPVIGRGDGESFNVGLLDVCGRPYPAFAGSVRASNRRIYDVLDGTVEPHDRTVDHLPPLLESTALIE